MSKANRSIDARQLSLWQSVTEVYQEAGDTEIDNATLYRRACDKAGISDAEFNAMSPVGTKGEQHKLLARTVRWYQQSLRARGVLERVPSKRGVWRLTRNAKTTLHQIERGFVILGFSTRLGAALWADCRDAFKGLNEPISLILTSPPYAISRGTAYGRFAATEWVDFICASIEPLMKHLEPGGSVVINGSNDQFVKGSPARELLMERLAIALYDRFGLQKMDTFIWVGGKAPGPVQWASKTRQQANFAYEPIYWACLDPLRCYADNRRVLQPHSERHKKLIARGGESRHGSYADGRYVVKPGKFGAPTPGRIPRNVLEIGTHCAGQRAYKAAAREMGLPAHGAPFPEALVEFFVQYLTEPGMLVIDQFSGSATTPAVCERLGRRWLAADVMAEYIRGGATRFDEVWINPMIDEVLFGPNPLLSNSRFLPFAETQEHGSHDGGH